MNIGGASSAAALTSEESYWKQYWEFWGQRKTAARTVKDEARDKYFMELAAEQVPYTSSKDEGIVKEIMASKLDPRIWPGAGPDTIESLLADSRYAMYTGTTKREDTVAEAYRWLIQGGRRVPKVAGQSGAGGQDEGEEEEQESYRYEDGYGAGSMDGGEAGLENAVSALNLDAQPAAGQQDKPKQAGNRPVLEWAEPKQRTGKKLRISDTQITKREAMDQLGMRYMVVHLNKAYKVEDAIQQHIQGLPLGIRLHRQVAMGCKSDKSRCFVFLTMLTIHKVIYEDSRTVKQLVIKHKGESHTLNVNK